MAGVLLPSVFLLVVLMGFIVIRLVYMVPIPVERVIVFPMAVVPNLWGLWNVLYIAVLEKRGLSLGAWGALLPLLLIALGLVLQKVLEASLFTALDGLIVLPIAAAGYYLLWKHAVGFLNNVVGVGNLNS
jgi:hypothetical protein